MHACAACSIVPTAYSMDLINTASVCGGSCTLSTALCRVTCASCSFRASGQRTKVANLTLDLTLCALSSAAAPLTIGVQQPQGDVPVRGYAAQPACGKSAKPLGRPAQSPIHSFIDSWPSLCARICVAVPRPEHATDGVPLLFARGAQSQPTRGGLAQW